MDGPDLYAEINDEPVPEGLSDTPHFEELYKRWRHQQQEQRQLLETIKELADENKRILKEYDDLKEEAHSLRKFNSIYKKNARMIFSVCRVELSKRERRIETLERRIESYGIVDGNTYSVAANSNEEDFSSKISLNLDTELKFTGILSELNNDLLSFRNRSTRDDINAPNATAHVDRVDRVDRDRPFDCRPFRGPKTPPTPSCSKPSVMRGKASSAERYDRKRNAPHSGPYQESQRKYGRYDDYSDDTQETYQTLNRRSSDRYEDGQEYMRDRKHIRRERDVYRGDSSHSDNSHSRYRELGQKDTISSRSESRVNSRSDRLTDRERDYDCDQYQESNRNYESGHYRGEYKRPNIDNGRTYDRLSADKHTVREDREQRSSNGIRRNPAPNEYEDFSSHRGSSRDSYGNRDRYCDNHYDNKDDRNYLMPHRNARRYNNESFGVGNTSNSHGNGGEDYYFEEREVRDGGNDSYPRNINRNVLDSRTDQQYTYKRSDKYSNDKESDKKSPISSSLITERESRIQRKHEHTMDDHSSISDRKHARASPDPRRVKEKRRKDRCDENGNGNVKARPSGPPPMDTSHEIKSSQKFHHPVAEKTSETTNFSSPPNISSSTSPLPSAAVKSKSDGVVKSNVNKTLIVPSSDNKDGSERSEQTGGAERSETVSSPICASKSTNPDTIETSTRSKMRKVRESKPILFTKIKEPHKPGDMESINTSLGVSFHYDVNKYSGKEIYHRNSRKEGLPPKDFMASEALRIQRKEAEDVERDNFVLGSEYMQKQRGGDPDKPTESTFSKRMREKIEREESESKSKIPAEKSQQFGNPASAITDQEEEEDEEEEEEGGAGGEGEEEERGKMNDQAVFTEASVATEKGDIEAACSLDDNFQGRSDDEVVQSPTDDQHNVCNDPKDEESQYLLNGAYLQEVRHNNSETDIEDDHQCNGVDDNSILECTPNVGYEVEITDKSPVPDEIIDVGLVELKPSPKIEESKDALDLDEFEEQVEQYGEVEESNEQVVSNDKQSGAAVYTDESHHGDTEIESENSQDFPVHEASETLEWDYDDDLHLEEVDTANVREDGPPSDEECFENKQESASDLRDGEMEEGEILDDSENDGHSSSGNAKDSGEKTKKKKKPKKSKIKKCDKGRVKNVNRNPVKSKKGKVIKSLAPASCVRVDKDERSDASRPKSLNHGKSQAVPNQRSQARTRANPSRSARHLDNNAETAHSSRAMSKQHMTDKYQTAASHTDHRVETTQSTRRSRPGSSAPAATCRRDVSNAKVKVRSRHKANLGSKDLDIYPARGVAHSGNSVITKDFQRSRRHEVVDRHRPRR